MNSQPLVSVIIPVYNAERFIERTVGCVIAQTYRNWELILVDDGSPDHSGDICDKIAASDSRIRVLHKQNGGAASARNAGLDCARGEFICFIDADDYITPDLISGYSFDFDISVGGILMDWRKGQTSLLPGNGIYTCTRDILRQVNRMDIVTAGSPVNKLYKSDILNKFNLRFYEDLHDVGEDHTFNWRYFLLCNTMCTSDSQNYIYEENEQSLTHRQYDKCSSRQATLSLNHLIRLNEILNCIQDPALKCECHSANHAHFSDTIIRTLYSGNIQAGERRTLLKLYKHELEASAYPTIKASNGVFNKLISISTKLPTPLADACLKSLFAVRRLITKA